MIQRRRADSHKMCADEEKTRAARLEADLSEVIDANALLRDEAAFGRRARALPL